MKGDTQMPTNPSHLPQGLVQGELEQDMLWRSLRARIDAAQAAGEKLVVEYREKMAYALLSGGMTIIPSTHLRDHEFVVSPGVYEAVKRISGKSQ